MSDIEESAQLYLSFLPLRPPPLKRWTRVIKASHNLDRLLGALAPFALRRCLRCGEEEKMHFLRQSSWPNPPKRPVAEDNVEGAPTLVRS